ncbi:MAG TPA: hypothetical protein PLL10_08850, partial [Elusimicrobiales bacterium]|nr:hypothetical protein [Elusimicrobiales bacterium]
MENIKSPQSEEEKKKKKGGFWLWFKNKLRGGWRSGAAPGRAASGLAGQAGQAGRQAALDVERGLAGLAARQAGVMGGRSGGGLLGKFGLAGLFGRSGFGGLLGRGGAGGALLRFLGTKAAMTVAGVALALIGVTAAIFLNSGNKENMASLPGGGFSPSGQSSAYPMPKDTPLAGDTFMAGVVPDAGSLSADALNSQNSRGLGGRAAGGVKGGGADASEAAGGAGVD